MLKVNIKNDTYQSLKACIQSISYSLDETGDLKYPNTINSLKVKPPEDKQLPEMLI